MIEDKGELTNNKGKRQRRVTMIITFRYKLKAVNKI